MSNFNQDLFSICRGITVAIATRYGLEGPGIESRWGRDFPYPSRPVLGLTLPLIQWVPGLFVMGKAAGAWRWPPTPSRAEVKERVGLYLYSPSGPSWHVLRWILSLIHSSRRTWAPSRAFISSSLCTEIHVIYSAVCSRLYYRVQWSRTVSFRTIISMSPSRALPVPIRWPMHDTTTLRYIMFMPQTHKTLVS